MLKKSAPAPVDVQEGKSDGTRAYGATTGWMMLLRAWRLLATDA
jgi:hypothetical protein